MIQPKMKALKFITLIIMLLIIQIIIKRSWV